MLNSFFETQSQKFKFIARCWNKITKPLCSSVSQGGSIELSKKKRVVQQPVIFNLFSIYVSVHLMIPWVSCNHFHKFLVVRQMWLWYLCTRLCFLFWSFESNTILLENIFVNSKISVVLHQHPNCFGQSNGTTGNYYCSILWCNCKLIFSLFVLYSWFQYSCYSVEYAPTQGRHWIFVRDYLRIGFDLVIPRMHITKRLCANAGKIFEIGSTGISSLGGHVERRSECVNMFVAEYGRMPLVSTSLKAVDSRNIWFWWLRDISYFSNFPLV